MKTVIYYSGILWDLANSSVLNIQHLKEELVHESLVVRLVYFPRMVKASPKRCSYEGVSEQVHMGEEVVYRKWGWSDDDVFVAFRLRPFCMSVSEGKIEGVMDFVVNELGFEASNVARCPVVLSLSLGKWIVPRVSVVLVLKSKGMANVADVDGNC
ncbi:hypothetical protein CR513_10013, partial [Mucuna pruriens]